MAFRPCPSDKIRDCAFGVLAEPGVENTRHRNGRPTDGKCLQRSRSPGIENTPDSHMKSAPASGRRLPFLAGNFSTRLSRPAKPRSELL